MKNALDWIKNNPISAVSIVVAFFGVVVFLFVLFVKAPALRARVVEDNSRQAKDLHDLTHKTVELPNPDPNEPPLVINNLVINQEMIDFVRDVYDEVEGQSLEIKTRTENLNARNHRDYTFVGGNLFGPDADPSPDQIVAASEDYRNSFDAMFMEGYEALNMPKLLIGMPPAFEDVQQALYQTLTDYLQSVGATTTADLTQAQAEELYQIQRVATMNLLTERAKSIQLYADALPLPVEEEDDDAGPGSTPVAQPVLTGMDRYSSAYPFMVADWAFADEQPSLDELWEGQVQIWITRDIMRAIAMTNSRPDGQPMPVIEAPVKRLLQLEIVPGYVGLHSEGGINGASSNTGSRPRGGNRTPGFGSGGSGFGGSGFGGPDLGGPGVPSVGPSGPGASPGTRPGARPGAGAPVEETPPAEVSDVYGKPALETLPAPEMPIIDSFHFGPTGRFSNSVFDVRHARLRIHIKWADLAAFEDTLRQINFMTVIDKTVVGVDEYEQLASGFVYGQDDVVEVELLIETLWYRSWTTDLMPQIVRDALLVQDDPDTAN